MTEKIGRTEVNPGPENLKCFFCRRKIQKERERYSPEWLGDKEVWMHNTCRFENWDEVDKDALLRYWDEVDKDALLR